MSITKHSHGSIKELWTLSSPLMLQAGSILFMIFVDRLFLSFYSFDAMNASINSSTTAWSILVFFLTLTSIAGTVFVSQYHGLGKPKKFGEPVWQMIWFALFSTLVFLPICLFGGDLIWTKDRVLEKQYFFWATLFGCSYPLYGAFSSFFIGQGKTNLVSYLALATNIVNILFDYILIFGIAGYIPSFGISGAAIATSLSMLVQVTVLAAIFFRQDNLIHKGTNQWQFNPPLFWKCLKVGAPGATAVGLEILAWAIFYEMMTEKGKDYIAATGIFQSFNLLFFFFEDGLTRGTSIIAGYLIGSGKRKYIPRILKNGALLQTYFAIFLILFLTFFGKQIINYFLSTYPYDVTHLASTIFAALPLLVIYLFLDGLRFNMIGVLTGAGDTLFLLISGVLANWILLLIPVYIGLYMFNISITGSLVLMDVFILLATLVVLVRYKFGNWIKLDLSKESVEIPPLHYN